jgi:hypothetical protein
MERGLSTPDFVEAAYTGSPSNATFVVLNASVWHGLGPSLLQLFAEKPLLYPQLQVVSINFARDVFVPFNPFQSALG